MGHRLARRCTLHFAICVPARNEAAGLPALFASLDALTLRADERITLYLLLDGCSDDSDEVARQCSERYALETVIQHAKSGSCNAGRARGAALDMGLQALGPNHGFLLTTDADSTPASSWIATMRVAMGSADLVAGAVRRTGGRICALHDRLERYLDDLFELRRELDPVPWEAVATHHHASGANIGLRADVLRSLGGVRPVASGEDALLLDDAARAGFRVRRDAACIVVTSDRRSGRATAGFARTLDWLDGVGAADVPVAHPDDAAWQYRRQASARAGYQADRLGEVAAVLELSLDHVTGVARDCPNAEAFAMQIVPTPPDGMREVPLPRAEAILFGLRERAAA